MSNVAVHTSENGRRGFIQTLKETFWTATRASTHTPPDRSDQEEKMNLTAQPRDSDSPEASNDSILTKDEEKFEDKLKRSQSKGKGKLFKKKKEIVSSSTAVPRVEICTGKKCKVKGSEQLLSTFQDLSAGRVEIAHTTCMSACKIGMNARVTKDGINFHMHNEVDADSCEQILCKHFEWVFRRLSNIQFSPGTVSFTSPAEEMLPN
ncbi:hypothetical protein R1sor_014425 [Riccia sorocarpa]|uniref:Uncharacterized protein n=1 Tax=Riccia sorocarpa TaxID=122646 RepID=A0ABD3HB70_9MARC